MDPDPTSVAKDLWRGARRDVRVQRGKGGWSRLPEGVGFNAVGDGAAAKAAFLGRDSFLWRGNFSTRLVKVKMAMAFGIESLRIKRRGSLFYGKAEAGARVSRFLSGGEMPRNWRVGRAKMR